MVVSKPSTIYNYMPMRRNERKNDIIFCYAQVANKNTCAYIALSSRRPLDSMSRSVEGLYAYKTDLTLRCKLLQPCNLYAVL